MKKAKLSLAWQILIGLVLGIAIGALLNHFSAEKAWWISNVLQPAGDIFIRLIKMIVIPIVISSLVVGIAGVGDAKKLGRIGFKTIIYFEELMRLLHPFMPFLTEELYQAIAERSTEEALVIAQQKKAEPFSEENIRAFETAKELISGVRNYRQSKGISPREAVELFTNAVAFENEAVVKKLANISEINFGNKTDKPSFTFLVGATEVSIPLSENLDLGEEKAKTEEELKALEAEGLEFNGYDGMMAEMKKGSLVIDDLSHYEMEKLIEKYHPDVFCAGIKEKYCVQKMGIPLKQLHNYDSGGPYAGFAGAVNFYKDIEQIACCSIWKEMKAPWESEEYVEAVYAAV